MSALEKLARAVQDTANLNDGDLPPDSLAYHLRLHGVKVVPVEVERVADDGTVRKRHYGDGEQPWDVMIRTHLAGGFAAGSVLKYVRRTKEPDEDRKKAVWYWRELNKLAHAPDVINATARAARRTLLSILTAEELSLLEPQEEPARG